MLLKWEDDEAKRLFWHSSSHLMAEALEDLFPGVKFGIGPAIENGFYYDVDLGGNQITDADFPKIEKRMLELAREKQDYTRIDVSKAEAMKHFRQKAESPGVGEFNERELTVLKLVCKGYTNKEIAGVLSLQPGTVKNIVSMLLSKTFCVSRADLTRYAYKNNLVDEE